MLKCGEPTIALACMQMGATSSGHQTGGEQLSDEVKWLLPGDLLQSGVLCQRRLIAAQATDSSSAWRAKL